MSFTFPHAGKNHELKFAFQLEKGNHKTVYDCLAAGQFYEPDLSYFFRRVIKEGDVVIDIGANLGFHSLLMAKIIGPQGKVMAFEPDPVNLADFKANIELNHLKNIAVHEAALGGSQSTVKLYSSKQDGGWNTVLTGAEQDFVASIDPAKANFLEEIPLNTLDVACAGGKYKVAKIDVEGYEGFVLDGARNSLARQTCDYWVVEYAPHCLAHFREDQWSIRKRFYEHGYECFVMSRLHTFPIWVPRETTILTGAIINLLFTKPEMLGREYRENDFGPFAYGKIA